MVLQVVKWGLASDDGLHVIDSSQNAPKVLLVDTDI